MSEVNPLTPLGIELKVLIGDESNKENECRRYLDFVKHYLFRHYIPGEDYVEIEYRGTTGDSDYVISGTVRLESGVECKMAYIWELKAPQCHIFIKQTENRLISSEDLYKAENQLITYHNELKGSDTFKRRFDISHPDHVKIGGIIIGCNNKKVRGEFENPDKKDILFNEAVLIRDHYFYNRNGIRLITWDTILDQLREPMKYEQVKEGELPPIEMPKKTYGFTVSAMEAIKNDWNI